MDVGDILKLALAAGPYAGWVALGAAVPLVIWIRYLLNEVRDFHQWERGYLKDDVAAKVSLADAANLQARGTELNALIKLFELKQITAEELARRISQR